MTAFDRFDLVDARVAGAIDEIAAASRPDYLDDIFRVTAQTRQRPRWTFLERWLPVDTAMPRAGGRTGLPARALFVVLVLALLAAALAAVYVGGQRRAAPPFGPAANGAIAYGSEDIYVRDAIDGASRLLIGGPGTQTGPSFSPDGTLVAYDNFADGVDRLWVANADGSGQRQVFDQAVADSWLNWSGDSRHLSIVGSDQATSKPGLYIVATDGSPARKVDLGDLVPNRTAVWDPQVPGQLLVRLVRPDGSLGLYYVHEDGTGLRELPTPWPAAFGKDWDLSGHAFSADGRHIVLNVITSDPGNGPGGYYRIGQLDRDGSNARILAGPTDRTTNEGWPTYSPDGKWITAQRFRWTDDPKDGRASLALLPADGSQIGHDVIPPFTPASNAEIDASWAPDSSRILAWVADTKQAFSIDPTTGRSDPLPWAADLLDWQRVSR